MKQRGTEGDGDHGPAGEGFLSVALAEKPTMGDLTQALMGLRLRHALGPHRGVPPEQSEPWLPKGGCEVAPRGQPAQLEDCRAGTVGD